MVYKTAKKKKKSFFVTIKEKLNGSDSAKVKDNFTDFHTKSLAEQKQIIRDKAMQGESAANSIISLLGSMTDLQVVNEIFASLTPMMLNSEHINALLKQCEHETRPAAKLSFIWLLGNYIDTLVIELFNTLMYSETLEVKTGIILMLVRSDSPDAIYILRKHLTSNIDPNVRLKIVQALQKIPGEEADETLSLALKDSNKEIVALAAKSIKIRCGIE